MHLSFIKRFSAVHILLSFLTLSLCSLSFAQEQLLRGFPDTDETSGRMINVTRGLGTLGDTGDDVLNVSIRVPSSELNVQIEIFDADTTVIFDDLTEGFWDNISPPDNSIVPDEVTFQLFRDPDLVGNTTPGDMIASQDISLLALAQTDNVWYEFVDMLNDSGAQTLEGDFGYHLVANWNTELEPNIQNHFKVRTNGLAFALAGSTIGFQGFVSFPGINDDVVPPVNYDGSWLFAAELRDRPEPHCFIDIFDGDFDRNDDIDDPNTDNVLSFYPFTPSTAAVPEGNNLVPASAGGDDNDFDFVRKFPSVNYTVTGPTGVPGTPSYAVTNDNPSGGFEYELFRIASSHPDCIALGLDPGTPGSENPNYDPPPVFAGLPNEFDPPVAAPDVIVPGLSTGFHFISIQGLDAVNNGFLNVSADIVPADSLFDFGDAPDSYGTDGADGGEGVGPRHVAVGGLLMGANIDVELDGAPSAGANGDDTLGFDDEDGVAAFNPLNVADAGNPYDVDVSVTNELLDGLLFIPANLVGWIDFNGNGTFEASEGTSQVVAGAFGAQTVTLSFTVPADVTAGDAFARFRLTTDAIDETNPTDGPIATALPANDGEVEDYALTIEGDECIPCKGMKNLTLLMSDWDDYGSFQRDPSETVRVRVGNLPGDFQGTNNYDAPIIFEGTVPNGGSINLVIEEQYWGLPLTVTVQDEIAPITHHAHEWGKSVFFPDCDLQLWTKSGNSYIEFKVIDFMKNSEDEDCPENCPTDFSFETDANGNPLIAGQIIDDEFIGYGITVTTNDPVNHPAMIFDSANPTGGDLDLGTPNQDFGGPGIGFGGASGQPGQNDVAEGKILIISEDGDSSDPDDNATGGTITFNLANPLGIKSLTLIDVETFESYSVRAYDETNSLINSVNMNGLGDNSRIPVSLNADAVSRLEVQFAGSGGIANIKFDCPGQCPTDDTSGYVKDHFSYKSYNNNDGSRDWSGPWEESDSGGNGPHGGNVRIYKGKLKLRKYGSSIEREVDVCASTDVWLKFKYAMSYKVDPSDKVAVEVSPDGGATWHLVDEYSGRHGWTIRSYDISDYASANTRVRFRISQYYGGYREWFNVSWIKISSN